MEKVDAQKFKILSGSVLKLIAVITMTVDHIAVAFAPWLKASFSATPKAPPMMA